MKKKAKTIKPTPAEIRNGWGEATLTAYVAERDKAAANVVFNRHKQKPTHAKHRFDPFRWRG